MALVVNTNVASITSQMYVNQTNKDMADTMARLSSGKRINTAADDAAGVAIASRLSSEIRGANQAIRNALDGQALIDTAEGAHLEIENILQRMRELAVQSANDTNNTTDRANLAAEMTQLTTEIDRIAAVTTWAGQNLLNGTGTSASLSALHTDTANFGFLVGSGVSTQDSISMSIGAVTAKALGIGGTAQNPVVTSSVSATATSGALAESPANTVTFSGDFNNGDTYTLEVNGISKTITTSNSDQYEDDFKGIAAQMNDIFQADISAAQTRIDLGTPTQNDLRLAGVTLTDNGAGVLAFSQASAVVSTATVNTSTNGNTLTANGNALTLGGSGAFVTNDSYTVTINGKSVSYTATGTDGFEDDTLAGHAAGLAAAISNDADLKAAGYSASATGGSISIVRDSLNVDNLSTTATGGAATLTESSGTFTVGGSIDNGDVFSLTIDGTTVSATISSTDGYSDDVTGAASQIAQAIKDANISGLVVTDNLDGTFDLDRFGSVDISDATKAAAAISALDAAITTVNTQRSNLGAVSNRLDSTVANLSNIAINLEDGRSRIEDADFAQESANLAKQQIMLQAGTAMLAQANASQQNVLSLLG